MSAFQFVEAVARLQLPSVFNPYADRCPQFDLPNGPSLRRKNLQAQLQAAVDVGVDTVWVARDLGYRGGRRTGIALTDEANLSNLSTIFGRELPLKRATAGPAVAERTASIVWDVITQLDAPVFTWNVFPLHPHAVGQSLSNRCHTRSERLASRPIIALLLELLRPKKIVAIGNDAAEGLHDLGIECLRVRHPSYGGKQEFVSGILSTHAHGQRVELGHFGTLF